MEYPRGLYYNSSYINKVELTSVRPKKEQEFPATGTRSGENLQKRCLMIKMPAGLGNLGNLGGALKLGKMPASPLPKPGLPAAGGAMNPVSAGAPGSSLSLGREAQGMMNPGGFANGIPGANNTQDMMNNLTNNTLIANNANNGLNNLMQQSQENQKQMNNLITMALAADTANKVLQLLQKLMGKNKESGGQEGGGGGGGQDGGDDGAGPSPEPDPQGAAPQQCPPAG